MSNEMAAIDLLVSSALELDQILIYSKSRNFIEDGKLDAREIVEICRILF